MFNKEIEIVEAHFNEGTPDFVPPHHKTWQF